VNCEIKKLTKRNRFITGGCCFIAPTMRIDECKCLYKCFWHKFSSKHHYIVIAYSFSDATKIFPFRMFSSHLQFFKCADRRNTFSGCCLCLFTLEIQLSLFTIDLNGHKVHFRKYSQSLIVWTKIRKIFWYSLIRTLG
jgi:hypothetical protein